jgi:acetoin:2,6-dichlorophenolindophenol oxidoreductase subunit alpha
VVVSFFGDGANNEGAFHETLNMASVWKPPVIFFCENNKYGMSTSIEHFPQTEAILAAARRLADTRM